jgi:hypothetical protein
MNERSVRSRPVDPPLDVVITVIPRRDQAAVHIRPRACLVVVLLIAAGAIVAAKLPGGDGGATGVPDARARLQGPAGVAAAYGHPLRCLAVTLPPGDPTFARADFNHGTLCGRYDGYVTAIFHRVDGAWRPVLEANGYSCPVASIPPRVQTELDVCA